MASILYVVERSSWSAGFQLEPSAASVPSTGVPSAVVMTTLVSLPLVTVTWAALLMLALVAPFFGLIAICASEASAAAALSTSRCDDSELPALVFPPLSPSSVQAESTSTPPSSADTATRPLRRLLSVITRFSIVADFPKIPGRDRQAAIPRQCSKNTRKGRSVPHPRQMWGTPLIDAAPAVMVPVAGPRFPSPHGAAPGPQRSSRGRCSHREPPSMPPPPTRGGIGLLQTGAGKAEKRRQGDLVPAAAAVRSTSSR